MILNGINEQKKAGVRQRLDDLRSILANDMPLDSLDDFKNIRLLLEENRTAMSDVLGILSTFFCKTKLIDRDLTPEEIAAHKAILLDLNPECDEDYLTQPRLWSNKEFNKPNLPVVIGEITDHEAFSKPNKIRVLDMPIRMPGQGWKIPSKLAQFESTIMQAAEHEKLVNSNFADCYCYVTIDQKDVEPNVSQRRFGWHTDAFVTDETGVQIDVIPENLAQLGYKEGEAADRTYVAADKFPTAFIEGPFDLSQIPPEEHGRVEDAFAEIAQGKEPFTFPPYTLIRLDPFTVHTAVPNLTNQTQKRTFIKIAFSPYKYNRQGNTHNDLFDYHWYMKPRQPGERGHRNYVVGNNVSLNKDFLAVNPSILFEKDVDLNKVEWVDGQKIKIQKTEKVRARKAEENERILTYSEDELISENIAPKGALVLTNERGQSYCLSPEKFKKFYEQEPDANGFYTPRQNPKTILRVTRNVRLYGPWGGMQYVKAGSGLVIDDKYDLYAIHPNDLREAYEIVSIAKKVM